MVYGLDKRIRRYRTELDEVLLAQSIDRLKVFMADHGMQRPSCDQMAEIILHKTTTVSTSLPEGYRKRSKAWLNARGYTAWDDGDL